MTVDPAAQAGHRLRRAARRVQTHVDGKVRRLEAATIGLHRVKIATRDPATGTCTVFLDGDESQDAPCRPIGSHVVPIVGQEGWAIRNSTDLLLTGMHTSELPKAKLRSTGTLATGGNPIFPWAAGDVRYDTDFDGTNAMFDDANNALVVRWPGVYAFGARGFVSGPAGAVAICRVQLNGGTYIDAWQDTIVNADPQHWTISNERSFVAGDSLQLEMSSTGGVTTWGTSSNEIGVAMRLSYLP